MWCFEFSRTGGVCACVRVCVRVQFWVLWDAALGHLSVASHLAEFFFDVPFFFRDARGHGRPIRGGLHCPYSSGTRPAQAHHRSV